MTIERIVNITWNPDEDGQPLRGSQKSKVKSHLDATSIFRVYNSDHEQDLTKQSQFNTSVVAEASPLACPTFNGDVKKGQYLEKNHIVATWIQ